MHTLTAHRYTGRARRYATTTYLYSMGRTVAITYLLPLRPVEGHPPAWA